MTSEEHSASAAGAIPARPSLPAYSKAAVIRHALMLSLVGFAPALLIATLLVFSRGSTHVPDAGIAQTSLIAKFLLSVIVIPAVETLLTQLLVIEFMLRIGVRRGVFCVPVSAILFIAAHYGNPTGMVSVISVIPAGFLLAYCYFHWRKVSGQRFVAFSATCLTHGLHNFYYWLLNFVPASVIFG